MIEWIVNKLFIWDKLREAIIEEVHLYDYLDSIMADPEAMKVASSHWPDLDGWRGWSKSDETGKYYFNDIPEDNAIAAMYKLEEMENQGSLDRRAL